MPKHPSLSLPFCSFLLRPRLILLSPCVFRQILFFCHCDKACPAVSKQLPKVLVMYLLALALLPLALAQYGPAAGGQTTSSSATATSSAASATSSSSTVHSVAVGNGGLLFQPDSVTAKMGETIEFHFYPKNHSVAQSSFASP